MTELWTDKATHDTTTHGEPVRKVTQQIGALLTEPPTGSYGHVLHADGVSGIDPERGSAARVMPRTQRRSGLPSNEQVLELGEPTEQVGEAVQPVAHLLMSHREIGTGRRLDAG